MSEGPVIQDGALFPLSIPSKERETLVLISPTLTDHNPFLFASYLKVHSSVGKELACNSGDPSLIPGLERYTGEGIGYPLQYSWASLVAQLVKNPPAMWETWVRSLGWEDPLEKGKERKSSILAWRIPWTIQSMGLQRVGHDWVTFTFTSLKYCGIRLPNVYSPFLISLFWYLS